MPHTNNCFTPFDESVDTSSLPERFTYPFNYKPHPLCVQATKQLQHHLSTQTEWKHNFGLEEGQGGAISGKMFGVLIVKTQQNQIGYLSAFSGALAGSNIHSKFVPPVFDALTEGSFLNNGMTELTHINEEITVLKELDTQQALDQIEELKRKRKAHSAALSAKLFEQYYFLNKTGEKKGLHEIFEDGTNFKIPGGAGDCAAPKLLQHAFQQNMKPLAMAEFFWGLSRGSDYWKHGHYYPACNHKCAPILAHMLKGIVIDEKPKALK